MAGVSVANVSVLSETWMEPSPPPSRRQLRSIAQALLGIEGLPSTLRAGVSGAADGLAGAPTTAGEREQGGLGQGTLAAARGGLDAGPGTRAGAGTQGLRGAEEEGAGGGQGEEEGKGEGVLVLAKLPLPLRQSGIGAGGAKEVLDRIPKILEDARMGLLRQAGATERGWDAGAGEELGDDEGPESAEGITGWDRWRHWLPQRHAPRTAADSATTGASRGAAAGVPGRRRLRRRRLSGGAAPVSTLSVTVQVLSFTPAQAAAVATAVTTAAASGALQQAARAASPTVERVVLADPQPRVAGVQLQARARPRRLLPLPAASVPGVKTPFLMLFCISHVPPNVSTGGCLCNDGRRKRPWVQSNRLRRRGVHHRRERTAARSRASDPRE